jgi:hypothetical protein
MRRSVPQRCAATGIAVILTAALLSARAADDDPASPPFDPVVPDVKSPSFGGGEGKSLKAAGIALYVAGAFFDLYTTKRAMDAGLTESNPLLGSSDSPRTTLMTAAGVKIGIAFTIGRAGRRTGDRARGAWFLSCGALQLGAALANRHATVQERGTLSSPTTPPVASQPRKGPSPSGAKTILFPGGN